ncbi:MAG: hypothetical protein LW875_05765 [Proteobacteria bacterium]|nr:hypothetical protein [Pseudomonadota bacterium]
MRIWVLMSFLILAGSWAEASKNRLEELFIWKVSEELKLSVTEEKQFSDTVRELNLKRFYFNEEIQKHLVAMGSTEASKAKSKLSLYRQTLKKYQDVNLEEIDRMQKILGPQKANQYFVLKNDLSQKLKNMISNPEKSKDEKPKEEKSKEEKPKPPTSSMLFSSDAE